ncbi:hypothetical protein BHM03_00048606 [Ensete ventricosum]|nr:hypothetical protein BHM03_00048606 [Ensete ventricosum]
MGGVVPRPLSNTLLLVSTADSQPLVTLPPVAAVGSKRRRRSRRDVIVASPPTRAILVVRYLLFPAFGPSVTPQLGALDGCGDARQRGPFEASDAITSRFHLATGIVCNVRYGRCGK